MSKVTIYDVAKEAGCSTATVSLVLQNSDKIKASTQQRVLDAVEKLGYLPKRPAQRWHDYGEPPVIRFVEYCRQEAGA